MPMVDQIEVCNRALSRIRAKPIADMNEQSLEARECRRHYPDAVSAMLDGPFDHAWSFSNVRAALALKTNDREDEWGYAYALPSNIASPIRVIPDWDAIGVGVPVPLVGQPYAETWAYQGGQFDVPYEIQGNTLYTNAETARLEYAIDDIVGLNVSSKVIEALSLDLGARLAVPVKADSNREKELYAAAQTEWARAIADDKNRHPTRREDYVPENIAARLGYGV